MTTVVVAENITANGDTVAVQVPDGEYMLAIGGTLGGGTVQVKVNVGPVTDVPVTDASYTAAGAERVSLPRCTLFVTVSGATAPDISVALGELSTKVED